MNKLKISATIITLNEEKNIERCLKSLDWVDEIVVVDSFSTDNTIQICKRYNCNVIQTEWQGYGNTKNFAVTQTKNNWIFSIDADEVISEELKSKVAEIINNSQCDGYNIKRRSFYLGKEIKHCGWEKDYPLRLFNKQKGNFNQKSLHEYVVVDGKKCKIEEPILHYTYPTISMHIAKMNKYTDISSVNNSKGNASILVSIFLGINKFMRMYFLQKGFLDGKAGFLLCLNSAFGVYLKYIKTWQS